MPDDKDRVQREIEDILSKVDHFPTEAARIKAERQKDQWIPSTLHSLTSRIFHPSLTQILACSIALVILSSFLIMPFAPTLGRYGTIAGIIFFSLAIVLSFRAPGGTRPGIEKRWRGRVIEPSPARTAGPDWLDQLFRRRRRP